MWRVTVLSAGQRLEIGSVPNDGTLTIAWEEIPRNLRWFDGSYLLAVVGPGCKVTTLKIREGQRLVVSGGNVCVESA